ncbi:MAG: hypothetical protein ACKOEX_11115 [Planctomycetia bacterium]
MAGCGRSDIHAGEPAKQFEHPRFVDPATSGLSFEVPKQTKWDVVVEKPDAGSKKAGSTSRK